MRISFGASALFILAILSSSCSSAPARTGDAHTSLADIKSSGVLRVGTTGDYKPYSFQKDEKDDRIGVDIELSRSLGQFMGLSVTFVKTTWPTLMQDLEENRFDIAMSGISQTPERAARAFFSEPYNVSGKTPIVRCADRSRLNTFEKIDRSEVRVITNPGGTNEKFARSHLKAANVIVFPDNKTIFEQISAGQADVMFTDSEEVKLQTKRISALCPAMPGKEFEPKAKAVLMHKDAELKKVVNLWIKTEENSGDLKRVFSKYLEE